MKLHKKLTVAGNSYPLVAESVQLSLFTPGRASFSVLADSADLKGVVVFYCGYKADNIKPWFVGFVESCTQADSKQVRIFCRELTAALYSRLPLALRNVTLKQTLAEITAATGLRFLLADVAAVYLSNKAAAFYNIGPGYHAMDSLADVFGIDRLIWQQQADGSVWVGSWNHSGWAGKTVEIPRNWETDVAVSNGATVPVLPALRPGATYNDNILTNVAITGTKMQLAWSKNPWADR